MNNVKSGQVDLTPEMFQEVQSVTGRDFTKFVHSESSTLSSDFNSLHRVCDENLSGVHSWINVQMSQLRSSLLHYHDCKRKDPYATSACVLVPAVQRGMFREMLKHWTVVKDIRAGTPILTVKDGVSTPTVSKYHMQVLYDPVMTEQLSAVVQDGRVTMHFVGQAAGTEVDFLFDSGASANYVSKAFAKLHGLVISPTKSNVELGTGSVVQPHGECSLHIRLDDYREKVKCLVIDMLSDFQVILGDDWLTKVGAIFDFGTARCTVKKSNRKYTMRSATRAQRYSRVKSPRVEHTLSAMQVKRALRRRDHILAIQLAELKLDMNLPADVRLKALLEEFADVFPPELPSGLPPARGVGHSIPIEPGAPPPFRPMYRLSPVELQEVKAKLADLLEKGLVEPSSSPYGAPILFVAKKDGSLRMVQDYRYLNKITIKNRYPLPRIDDLLDSISGSKYFSSLDLTSGYYQIRITDEDVPKTAFRTPFGLYQFKVLTFGLTNAPATFQAVMNDMLKDFVNDKFVVVYLDDILIHSKSEEEHERHLRLVLQRLREHKFYANLKKCEFKKQEIAFLGHIVGVNGIKVDPKKVQAVADWDVPKDVHGVRSFLGLANYFRRFLQGFSKMVAPLTNLTKKTNRWDWTSDCQQAFERVKRALTEAPVLVSPDTTKPYEVISDASGIGLGAVLLQDGRPVAFESRKLSGAEQNYTVTEQEMLGVIHALQTWRCYLEGSEFTVVTDHCPNTFFNTQANLSRRQARWAEFLQRFKFTWEYRPGRTNVADPLSRNPCQSVLLTALLGTEKLVLMGGAADPNIDVTPRKTMSPGSVDSERLQLSEDFRKGYASDPWFRSDSNLKGLHFDEEEGLWYLDHRVVVPAGEVRERILQESHDAPYSGHVGRTKSLQLVTRNYWWPHLRQDVTNYVLHCPLCQRNKGRTMKQAGLLQPLPVPTFRWESVSLDFIMQLPMTRSGHDAIVVFVDRLTKMVHFAPTHTKCSAEDVAKLFAHNVFRHHGLPAELVSDRDPRFTSKFWVELARLLGTQLKMSTAFHPQTDGQTERANRILEDYLRHYISPQQDDWDEWLYLAEFSVNNAWQESVKETPFMLNTGQHPRTPLDGGRETRVPQATDFVRQIDMSLARAKQSILAAQSRMKSFADQKRRDVSFAKGEKVLLSTQNFKLANPGTRKLLPKWVGPFEVIEPVGKVAYKLKLPPNLKMHNVFHVNLVKPYRNDGRVQPPPPPIEIDDSLEYEVERVLDDRKVKRGKSTKTEFLVKWLGYGPEHNTWEPEKNLTNCKEILEEYWVYVGKFRKGVPEPAQAQVKTSKAKTPKRKAVTRSARQASKRARTT